LAPDDLLLRLPDLLAGFRDATGPDRMKRGLDLVALVARVPAEDRASLLRSARAADTLVPLLAVENTGVVLSAVKLLADSAEPAVVPPMLEAAARASSLRGYVADAVKRIAAASGEAGAAMAHGLARSEDVFVRSIGVACGGTSGGSGATLDDPSPLVRASALRALERSPTDARAVPRVLECLRADGDRGVRVAAAQLTATWRVAAAAPVLAEVVRRDPDALVRRAAVEAIAALRPPESGAWLAGALGDADAHVADAAVAALVSGAPADALEGLAYVLTEGRATPRAAEVASHLGPPGVDLVALLLQDARADVRAAAVRARGPAGDAEERGRRMAQRACAFDGPVGPDGRAALWTLAGELSYWPQTLGDLELVLRGQADPAVAPREAAWLLFRRELATRTAADVEALLSLVARRADAARLLVRLAVELDEARSAEARRVLARLRGVDVADGAALVDVGSLVVALLAPAAPARVFAATALGRFGCDAARGALEQALEDPDDGVRDAASAALGALGDARACEPLQRAFLRADDDARRRGAAATALGALGDEAVLRFLAPLAAHPAELDAVAVLARRAGPAAYDGLVAWMGGAADRLPAGLVAAGATGDPRAVELMSLWLSHVPLTAVAVRGLGETRLPDALAPLLRAYREAEQTGQHASVDLHEALAVALDSIAAARPAAISDEDLDALAALDVVFVTVWFGDVTGAVPVSYAAVRARAGEERVRRGGAPPGPPSVQRLGPADPLRAEPAPGAPAFLRLPLARRCACGVVPTPLASRVPGWWTARCPQGHEVRYAENYLPLVADRPTVD
jgi:HEAT repeat protein